MKLLVTTLFILSLLITFRAKAEGGCPPGQYPQQGQGWQTCVPIPGAADNQQSPPSSQHQWVSQWQALATDSQKAVLGVATGKSSSDDSAQAAVADCKAKGGTTCKVQITYRNGCIAMVVGKTGMNTQGAPTKDGAESAAIAKCSAGDTNCHVYYSACNGAIRVN